MGQAHFTHEDFLQAARKLVFQGGPSSVTVGAVTERLGAPTGSFYHRFTSRDVLLGQLWVETILAFQEGFIASLKAGEGLAAALHTPGWVRGHLEEACLLLLYHRDDFVRSEWPEFLKKEVAKQSRVLKSQLRKFAEKTFGGKDPEQLRRAAFVLIDVPKAAVRPHMQRHETPPLIVDELIRTTYYAIVGGRHTEGIE